MTEAYTSCAWKSWTTATSTGEEPPPLVLERAVTVTQPDVARRSAEHRQDFIQWKSRSQRRVARRVVGVVAAMLATTVASAGLGVTAAAH
jgi:hypothetical protein